MLARVRRRFRDVRPTDLPVLLALLQPYGKGEAHLGFNGADPPDDVLRALKRSLPRLDKASTYPFCMGLRDCPAVRVDIQGIRSPKSGTVQVFIVTYSGPLSGHGAIVTLVQQNDGRWIETNAKVLWIS